MYSNYDQFNPQPFQGASNIHSQPNFNEYSPLNEGQQLVDRTKQSSPIYDIYAVKNMLPSANTAKRHHHIHSMLKDSRVAPYTTTKPGKRNTTPTNPATNTSTGDSLSVSPVYSIGNSSSNSSGINSSHQSKLEYTHESSDDSLNLTENFLHQINNQNNSSTSFTLSSSASSSA